MPIDPTTLPSAAAGMQIVSDLPCRTCGYNLVGLQAGGTCPECGATIPIKRFSARGDNLTDAPASYLHRIAMASAINAFSAPAALIVGLLAWMTPWLPLAALSMLGATGFAIGVFVLTIPRPRGEQTVNDATLDGSRWRLGARLGAASWIFFGLVVAAQGLAGTNAWGGQGAWSALAWAGFLVACVASVPLLIVVSSLADWSGDAQLASRLRGAAWVLGVGAPVVLVVRTIAGMTTGSFNGFVYIVLIGLMAVYTVALLFAGMGFVQFAGVAFAAVRTNREQHARDQRIAARRAADMRDTVERQFSAPEPVDPLIPSAGGSDHPEPAHPHVFSKGARIERAGETETYDLEPVDDDPERTP
ncbi:MAG: hypothetical protein AAGB48_04335 [Planctomycetota bacterium]